MLKVNILTFHNVQNYGAMLQAYALKEVIKMEGYDASFINYQNRYILRDYKLIKFNRVKSFFSSIYFLPRNLRRKKNFKRFSDKYLDTLNKKVYREEEILETIDNNAILVSGSDQILNPKLTGGLSDIYTLNFGKNYKIIYGASVGNEELLEESKEDFKNKLKSVDLLSVREKNVSYLLQEITGKSVYSVLDPTLLLNKEKWDEIILNEKKCSEDYILVYTLFEDENLNKIVNEISLKTGLKVVHFRKYNIYTNELTSLYDKGPIEFVSAFKHAKYIFTNSFHGTIFSIIYNKLFYCVLPKERAGRLVQLLDSLNLKERIITNITEVNLEEKINYLEVEKLLNYEREKSLEFIKKGLKCQKKGIY